MKCARTACQETFDATEKHFAIWNDTTNEPRLYCCRCGNRIVVFNRKDEVKLKYEVREGSNS